jgi:1-acyl-sn-glycerol-3-phosphate acyltransferase
MPSGGGNKPVTKGPHYPSPIVVAVLRLFAFAISKLLWFIRFEGKENIPGKRSGGVVVVSNHPTYFDPAWISLPIRKRLRYMAWHQAFEWHFLGPLIRYLGAFPVKHDSKITKSSVVESLRTLRDGAALIIFPEGEREFADGRLLGFKSGAAHIALTAGVPVLPVTVRGGSRVWPQGQKYPRFFRRVVVTYHPLMNIAPPPDNAETDDYIESLNDQIMKAIKSSLKG